MRMKVNDNRLAIEAARGDRAAFQALLERHYDLVFRVALRFVQNRDDAADIAQDVAVSLPKRLKTFKGKSRFTTWLYQVSVNASRDFLRRRSRVAALNRDFTDTDALKKAGEADRQSMLDEVYRALDALSEDLRETALLVLAEGLSHAETAEILGVKENTVSWRMHEMRRRLKEEMTEDSHD